MVILGVAAYGYPVSYVDATRNALPIALIWCTAAGFVAMVQDTNQAAIGDGHFCGVAWFVMKPRRGEG